MKLYYISLHLHRYINHYKYKYNLFPNNLTTFIKFQYRNDVGLQVKKETIIEIKSKELEIRIYGF